MRKSTRMLCHRCEHRVSALEQKSEGKAPSGPRFECSDFGSTSMSCYMYSPIKPIFVQPRDSRNPISGTLLSSRLKVVQNIEIKEHLTLDVYLLSKNINEGYAPYYRPSLKSLIKLEIRSTIYKALKSLKQLLYKFS